MILYTFFFFFQAEDGIRDLTVTGVQTCALPILVCANLAEVGRFARLDTWQFRILRACLPGPYTFLLRATRETPRRLQHARRRTIGVRIPDHEIGRAHV